MRIDDPVPTLLRSRKTEDRLKGLRLLAEKPCAGDVTLLLPLLYDPSQIAASRAVRLLADRSYHAAVPKLLERYRWYHDEPVARDPGCTVRSEIVQALGVLAGRQAVDVLRLAVRTVQIETVAGGLEDTATGLRANAALALANVVGVEAATDLAILLFDMKPNVAVPPREAPYAKVAARAAAARALGQVGGPPAEALLAAKLAHPAGEVPEVLVECMDALVAVGSARALELIAPLLRHKEPYVVAGAATALAASRAPEVAELLHDAVEFAVHDARESIILALAALRSDAALVHLVALLQHPDGTVRAAAAEALDSFSASAVAEARERAEEPS